MRTRRTLLLIVTPAIVWVLVGFLGNHAASTISSHFGSQILARADGKFTNVQIFVKGRLKDGAVLLTAGCLLLLAYQWLVSAIRGLQTPARWLVQGWGAFICLNIFAAVAGHTVLFWCLLFTGKDHTHNFTQYQIKHGLMKELDATRQAVLLGASQTRTQIDTKVLNECLGGKIWTTELHYPGSSPYDMRLSLENLPPVPLDYIITYVSETTFYSGSASERLMFFFGFRDLPGYCALGPGKPPFDRYLVCGLLGDMFPLYRMWEPIMGRVRGWKAENQAQQRYNQALESDLAARAKISAKGMVFGPASAFHKAQFVSFAKMCGQRHCRLIVCCGQLNPILEHDLDPAFRRDMLAFLHEQAKHDPNIILLEPSQLPPQPEDDYEDLTHVNKAARQRFSEYIAGVLDGLLRQKQTAMSAAVPNPAVARETSGN